MALDLTKADDPILEAFGEEIVYRPAEGRPRRITAIVDRNPEDEIAEARPGISPMVRVTVRNDPGTGISSRLIDTGGDAIDMDVRKGGPVTERAIVRIVRHDEGFVELELR